MRGENFSIYLRNFMFGVEDSLVSTVGLLAGVAAANVPRTNIIITGVVLILVEALSMGVGSILSEHSVEEYQQKREVLIHRSVVGGVIMVLSYFFSGFIPLFPYMVLPIGIAFWTSIGASLFFLLLLGFFSAKFFGVPATRKSIEMLVLGGLAILIGVAAGVLMNSFLV